MLRPYRCNQAQRMARRPRADRLDQLGEEGATDTRDLGVRVALQRVERKRHTQRRAVPKEGALVLGQGQFREIRAAGSLLHSSELAVALEQRTDPRVAQGVGAGPTRLGSCLRGRTALHKTSI